MARGILLVLDGVDANRGPSELALAWARQFDCLLAALGIVDAEALRTPEPVPLGGGHVRQELVADRIRRAKAQLEGLLSRFAQTCGERQVACKLLEAEGDPCEQIHREAQRYDLIVLGRECGFPGDVRADSRETLDRVLAAAPRPIVSVPSAWRRGSSIVVAYDGSLQAARTVQALVATGLHSWLPLHVVGVHDDAVEAGRRADRAVEFLALHGVRAERHALHTNLPVDEALRDEAERLDAGLVVMGAYGQSTLREFFLGSVTRRMLDHCSRPLFLYH